MDLEQVAEKLAGNWQRFDNFSWQRAYDMDNAAEYGIAYTHNRDSGILEESNADAIDAILQPFTKNDDVILESHTHWAVGWVDGYAIRVYRNRDASPDDPELRYTAAFLEWAKIVDALEGHPVLDDDDYGQREDEARMESIIGNRPRDRDFVLPEDWAEQVYSWLWENDEAAMDDRECYVSEDAVLAAVVALWGETENVSDETEEAKGV